MIRGRVTDGAGGRPGVLVSDGHSVVVTDAAGEYVLAGAGPFVMVTRPTGWTTEEWFLPVDALNHEFVLAPVEQPLPLTFVQVTDLHLSLGETEFAPDGSDSSFYLGADGELHERVVTSPDVLDGLWRDVAARVPDAAFIAATGDLTNTGSDAEYQAWVISAAGSQIPVISIPGNHDHHAQGDEVVEGTSVDLQAVPSRYEAHIGPRWFSFDHAGLHVVAIDWFTHLLGIDADVQEAWLRADLLAIPDDQPVVLLSHDQMPTEFFDRMPRRPIATFSGHWHTSRVARVDGTLHVNTPTAMFGGLDYSPAALRVARWDGADLTIRSVTRAAAGADGGAHDAASFRAGISRDAFAQLPGAGHRATPVVAGDLVLATSRDEDRPAGWLTAIDRSSGDTVWQVGLASAVKASPVMARDAVVTAAVTGEVVCVGLDGVERWRRHLDDPLRLWTYLRPVADDQRVYVGDVARFSALDLETGAMVWEREDLGQRENLTSWADPVIVGDTLVVAFAGQTPVMYGLDPVTGTTRWPLGEVGRSIYRLPPGEVAGSLVRSVAAPVVPDEDDMYVVRLGAALERVRVASGEVVWSVPHHGWFNPGAGALVGDLVVLATGMGRVRAYTRANGQLRWDTAVTAPAPIAAGPYRSRGPLVLGGVTAFVSGSSSGVVAATGDGFVVSVSADGEVMRRFELPAPALGGVAVDEAHAWTVTSDGGLHRVPLG